MSKNKKLKIDLDNPNQDYAYNDTYWNIIDDNTVLGCGRFAGVEATKEEIYDWVSKQFLIEALQSGGVPIDCRKFKRTEDRIEELKKLIAEGATALNDMGVKNELIDGELDEDGCLEYYDNDEVEKFVISKILKPLFGVS